MKACHGGHIDIVKLLVESGAYLDIQDEDVSEIIIINIIASIIYSSLTYFDMIILYDVYIGKDSIDMGMC